MGRGLTVTKQKMVFVPPCFVKISFEFKENDAVLDITFIAVPISKNQVKFINIFNGTVAPRWMSELTKTKLGKWWFNRRNLKILNQDRDMILKLTENLNYGSPVYKKIVSADSAIKKYRDWYRESHKTDPWFKGYQDIEDLCKE